MTDNQVELDRETVESIINLAVASYYNSITHDEQETIDENADNIDFIDVLGNEKTNSVLSMVFSMGMEDMTYYIKEKFELEGDSE